MAMRVITNVISYVTPPVGIALTLWATFQWDLPVPLALIFISLAWAYSLGLVVAALVASREDESAADVLLDHGTVESMYRDSQDSSQIELLVGTDRQRFAAPDAMIEQLVQGDSVVFAHTGQSRKIIRIATFNASSSGRVSLRGERQRKDVPESHARRIFSREDLYDQATFAVSWPLGSSFTLGILGLEVWDWGSWSWIFFGLSAIWFILFFDLLSISKNYGDMTKIELDIGYVQEVKNWLQAIGDSDSANLENQTIVIAGSAPPNGLEKREHTALDNSFEVREGDLVMLTTDANGYMSKLRMMVIPPLSLGR